MAVIKYDSDYFTNSVLPSVADAKDYLDDARRYTYNFSIPSEFKYRQYLNGLSNSIYEKKSKLVTFENWTSKLKTVFDSINEDHQEKIDKIDDSILKKRNKLGS